MNSQHHRPDHRDDGSDERFAPAEDERPPFGRRWTTLYALVVANLALLILFFYLFTRAFR